MPTVAQSSLRAQLATVPDPRIDRTKRHLLLDILVIAVCAVLAGAEDWVSIAEFGRIRRAWFQQFLALPNGIPSHDTFRRVFLLLDSQVFAQAFRAWVQGIAQLAAAQGIAIDGKTLRRSHDAASGHSAISLVSAWATANRLVLAQLKVDDKSNEITAIPELLRVLELQGCIVTIDAIGCQTDIAQTIVDRGGDYVLAVKGNQAGLHQEVQDLFADATSLCFKGVVHAYCKQTDKGHGRLEIRRCWTIADPDYLQCIRRLADWPRLQTLVKVDCERRMDSGTTRETRYYISSLPNDAKRILHAVRGHWGIENQLHWVLDVAFREDQSRLRKGHGAENFAMLRHMALNLLQHDTTAKLGVKNKRLRAGWDPDYLITLLTQ